MGQAELAFGVYLLKLRTKMGLTLRQVEKEAGVSNAFLSQVERGERGIPSIKVLTRLAKVYGKSPSELVKAAEIALGHKKLMGEKDLDFVARGLEKLTDAERKEFIGWLKFKVSQKGGATEE